MAVEALSLIFGAFCAAVSWIFLRAVNPEDAWLAIPFGLGVTLLLSVTLRIILHFEEKRYRQAEARFPEPPLFACEGAVYRGSVPHGARLYLFRDSVAVISAEKKNPLTVALPLTDIREIRRETMRNGCILHLYGPDDEVLSFFGRDGERAADLLSKAMQEAKGRDSLQEETDDN